MDNNLAVNVKLKDTKVFQEITSALKFLLNDTRIDVKIRQEYESRLKEHLKE